jgi:hypothetical protein
MADDLTGTGEETKEITLKMGTQGTAFALGLLTGAVAGVIAVICILNYAKK